MRRGGRKLCLVPSRRLAEPSCTAVGRTQWRRPDRLLMRPDRHLVTRLDLAATGTLLWCLFHALRKQRLELTADLPGLALDFVQKPALLVVDFAVGEEHLPQPGGLIGVDVAIRQDVVLDGL